MKRNLVPTLVVCCVIAATVGGGFVVAGALSEPAGPPVVVGGVVRVFPLSGWQDTGAGEVGDLAGGRLTRGSATLDVLTRSTDLGAEAVLVRYVRRFLEPAASTLDVSEDVREVRLDNGLTGLRLSYTGTFGERAAKVDGEVTATASPNGTAVIFDAWGPSGMFGYAAGDTREMVRTAEIA